MKITWKYWTTVPLSTLHLKFQGLRSADPMLFLPIILVSVARQTDDVPTTVA